MWDRISEMRCGITGKDGNKPEKEAAEEGTPKLWAANSIFLQFFGLPRASLQGEGKEEGEGDPSLFNTPKRGRQGFHKVVEPLSTRS